MRNVIFVIALLASAGIGNADLLALAAETAGPGTVMSLYRIDESTAAATAIGSTGVEDLHGLAVDPMSGRLYSTGGAKIGATFGLYELDPNTGAATYVGGTQKFIALDFSPGGVLYAQASPDGWSDDLYTIDTSTGVETFVSTMPHGHQQGLAFSVDGSEIFWHRDDWLLQSFDPGTTTLTVIAPLSNGMTFRFAMSPAGVLYANSQFAGTMLQTIDTTTAAITVVGDTGVRIQGLAFAPEKVPATGPASLVGLGVGLGLAMAFARARGRR